MTGPTPQAVVAVGVVGKVVGADVGRIVGEVGAPCSGTGFIAGALAGLSVVGGFDEIMHAY